MSHGTEGEALDSLRVALHALQQIPAGERQAPAMAQFSLILVDRIAELEFARSIQPVGWVDSSKLD